MIRAARKVVINGPLVGEQRSGPAVHLTELVRAMLDQRPELTVVARHCTLRGSDANRRSAAHIDQRIRAVTTPVPNTLLRGVQSRLRVPPERLLVGGYDVYHQLHTDADPAVPDRKLVVTLHDTVALDWPDEEGRIYSRAGKLLRRAAAVITVSEFSKAAICAAFDVDAGRVHIIPNGVDHDRFRPSAAENADQPVESPYLLYAGGHTPRKNVPRMIEAFASVRRQRPDSSLTLTLAGPVIAAEAELRSRAPADLPHESLHFLGHVPDGDMPSLYARAEALVYPSLHEGFGMPIVEAMACGTAVVTSDRDAMREVAGGAAVLVDPTDTESVASGLVHVLSESAAERNARRRRGIVHAAGFTWKRSAADVLTIYDEVGARASKGN